MKKDKKLISLSNELRKKILNMIYLRKSSHLGSNLSVVEILIAIYSLINTTKIIKNKIDRDRVFISKGHCAAAVYSVLEIFNILKKGSTLKFLDNKNDLAAHVCHSVKGVEHSTGALGHGLPCAVGAALGLRSRNLKSKVFVICGDGELQEGSIWESLMLASHHKLNNLEIFIDYNKISSITLTNKVLNIEPLAEKFKSFGFNVFQVDGHNLNSLTKLIKKNKRLNKPKVYICHTIKGKGVSFCENKPIWHYKTLDKKLFEQAIKVYSESN